MEYAVTFRSLDKELLRVSRWRGAADLAVAWVAIFAAVTVAGRCAALTPLGVTLALVGFVVIGVFQHGLAALAHHAVHFNLHPDKAINDRLFRWLSAAPTGQSLIALRREHLLHHATFGTERDPERYYYDLTLERRDTPARFVSWSIAMFVGYVLARQIHRRSEAARDPAGTATRPSDDEAKWILVAQAALFVAFWGLTGSWLGYFLLWAAPLVTVGGGLNGLRATLEHADPSPRRNLNHAFVSNPIERWAFGPYNFSYHYEHHRFMTVPYYRVAAVRRILQEAGDYGECSLERSYVSRYLAIVETLRRRA